MDVSFFNCSHFFAFWVYFDIWPLCEFKNFFTMERREVRSRKKRQQRKWDSHGTSFSCGGSGIQKQWKEGSLELLLGHKNSCSNIMIRPIFFDLLIGLICFFYNPILVFIYDC